MKLNKRDSILAIVTLIITSIMWALPYPNPFVGPIGMLIVFGLWCIAYTYTFWTMDNDPLKMFLCGFSCSCYCVVTLPSIIYGTGLVFGWIFGSMLFAMSLICFPWCFFSAIETYRNHIKG